MPVIEKSIYIENVEAEIHETDDEISWIVTNEEISREKNAHKQADNLLTLARRQCSREMKKHLSFTVKKWLNKTESSGIGVKALIGIDDNYPNAVQELDAFVNLFQDRCLKMQDVIDYVVQAGQGNPDKIQIVKGNWGSRSESVIEVDDDVVIDMVCFLLGRRQAAPTSNVITFPGGKIAKIQMPAKSKPELKSDELIISAVVISLSSDMSCNVEVDGKKYVMALVPSEQKRTVSVEYTRVRLTISYLIKEPVSMRVKSNVEYRNGVEKMHSLVFCEFVDSFERDIEIKKISALLNDVI
jgi:hypothetical protein